VQHIFRYFKKGEFDLIKMEMFEYFLDDKDMQEAKDDINTIKYHMNA
jgi:hypothetical protein